MSYSQLIYPLVKTNTKITKPFGAFFIYIVCYNPNMNLEDLNKLKSEIETSYTNLSNPQWVASELSHLKGKYEILNQVIAQGEQNATTQSASKSKSNSNNN